MKKILLLIFAVVAETAAWGQTVQVRAEFDSAAILIGEQTKLTVEVAGRDAKTTFVFPMLDDSLAGGLELVERLPMDTTRLEDGTVKIAAHYLMTGWDSALVYIEALPVVAGGDTFWSNGLTLEVVDIPVDTVDAICDIKPVYEPPFDWRFFWTVLIIIVLSLLLICGGVWVYFKYLRNKFRKGTAEDEKPVDPRPAHVIAMEQLENLRQEKLWQGGEVKRYYSRLTEIVKVYVSRRYDINATEQTTDELLLELKMNTRIEASKESVEDLRELLQMADLVKFAKWKPLPEENDRAFEEGKEFVQMTKQEEIKEEKKNDVR